ncbi:ankyrin repeat and SOCS box protein 3 [Anopheles bellator]|uniref:ankyrin repeat and SOCS box protein 3 n=1 Tax=Anopheles bellator TaxID=139047 RepID=UPI002647F67A|nr:ankyrin repeat and SOCS box protein 3 [Anopheles bellator]
MTRYVPAGFEDSDEDDFDEFGFISNPFPKKSNEQQKPEEDYENLLHNALCDGNLEETKRIMQLDAYRQRSGGRMMCGGWPVIFYVCLDANRAILEYLLKEEKVDVNQAHNMETALMKACQSSKPTDEVYPIVRLLLEAGAHIEVMDQYGNTPLMFACQRGHLSVVKEIVDESPLTTVDRDGNTALFLAVMNNHCDVVKELLRAGADYNIVNRKKFTPRQYATFENNMEIVALFPAEEEPYELPTKYLVFSHCRDLVHGDTEGQPPEYCWEIDGLLFGADSEKLMPFFAKKDLGLFDFLTMTDDRLRDIGIKYPIQRKRILLALYDFHLQPWSNNSLDVLRATGTVDAYDVLEILGNLLKHVTVLHSTLLYTQQLVDGRDGTKVFETVTKASNVQQDIHRFKTLVRLFRAQILKQHKVSSPKPVLQVEPQPKGVKRFSKAYKIGTCLLLLGSIVFFKLKK